MSCGADVVVCEEDDAIKNSPIHDITNFTTGTGHLSDEEQGTGNPKNAGGGSAGSLNQARGSKQAAARKQAGRRGKGGDGKGRGRASFAMLESAMIKDDDAVDSCTVLCVLNAYAYAYACMFGGESGRRRR